MPYVCIHLTVQPLETLCKSVDGFQWTGSTHRGKVISFRRLTPCADLCQGNLMLETFRESAALAVTGHPTAWLNTTYLENKHAFQETAMNPTLNQMPRRLFLSM